MCAGSRNACSSDKSLHSTLIGRLYSAAPAMTPKDHAEQNTETYGEVGRDIFELLAVQPNSKIDA